MEEDETSLSDALQQMYHNCFSGIAIVQFSERHQPLALLTCHICAEHLAFQCLTLIPLNFQYVSYDNLHICQIHHSLFMWSMTCILYNLVCSLSLFILFHNLKLKKQFRRLLSVEHVYLFDVAKNVVLKTTC